MLSTLLGDTSKTNARLTSWYRRNWSPCTVLTRLRSSLVTSSTISPRPAVPTTGTNICTSEPHSKPSEISVRTLEILRATFVASKRAPSTETLGAPSPASRHSTSSLDAALGNSRMYAIPGMGLPAPSLSLRPPAAAAPVPLPPPLPRSSSDRRGPGSSRSLPAPAASEGVGAPSAPEPSPPVSISGSARLPLGSSASHTGACALSLPCRFAFGPSPSSTMCLKMSIRLASSARFFHMPSSPSAPARSGLCVVIETIERRSARASPRARSSGFHGRDRDRVGRKALFFYAPRFLIRDAPSVRGCAWDVRARLAFGNARLFLEATRCRSVAPDRVTESGASVSRTRVHREPRIFALDQTRARAQKSRAKKQLPRFTTTFQEIDVAFLATFSSRAFFNKSRAK